MMKELLWIPVLFVLLGSKVRKKLPTFVVNHLSFCPHNEVFKNAFIHQLLFKLPSNTYLPPIESSCGWAPAVFLCERRSDPPGLLLGRLDIGTSLLKGHTLSRHYHSLKGEKIRKKYQLYVVQHRNQMKGTKDEREILCKSSVQPSPMLHGLIWNLISILQDVRNIPNSRHVVQNPAHKINIDFAQNTQEILKENSTSLKI